MRLWPAFPVLAVGAVLCSAAPDEGPLSSTFPRWRDHPAILYTARPTTDPIADLNRRIDEGRSQLRSNGASGFLQSLLDALNVPIESQVAVFAKDSVQASRITPHNPRTIFFNETVAVGWVAGGFIELAAQDPQQGVVFYTLDRTPLGKPRFTRRDDCLTCHYSYSTVGVPGMLERSVGQFTVDHRLPLEQRWGGWYVTGTLGAIRHLGNTDTDRLFESPPPSNTLNWPSLDGRFDTAVYLSAHSDITALMVFAHQMHMMNLLTRIGWEARVAAYEKRTPMADAGNASDIPVPLRDAAKEVADYLLFVDEAGLADTIQGSTRFAEKFAAQGPRDRKGRSLRQFELKRRLMRYSCSYMIYSPLFDALPAEARDAIYRRMWEILSGEEKAKKYRRLSAVDRAAIVEILRDTKQDLPSYFSPPARQN